MAQERIKYKQISAKLVGSNVVNYRLEDGTLFKIHVDLARVGVAVDRKSPDGMPLYNFGIGTRVEVQSKDKIYYAPLPRLPTQNAGKKGGEKAYTT